MLPTPSISRVQVPRGDVSGAQSSSKAPARHLITVDTALTSASCTALDTSSTAITHLTYGGGPHVLLAAASATRLTLLSLEPLLAHTFEAESGASASGGTSAAHGWDLPAAVHAEIYVIGSMELGESDGGVIALSWTQQLDGVLVSRTGGALQMWELLPVVLPEAAKAEDRDAGFPPAAPAALRLSWATEAPEPQDLLSAGVNTDAPSASACTAGEKCANIWWPGGENPPAPERSVAGVSSARRERLKHTCNVVGLEWCPGVLRKDILAAGLGTGGPNSPGAAGGTAVGPGSETASTSGGPEDHPALMTLGSDDTVRIWVEMLVVTQPQAALAAPGSPERGKRAPSPPPQPVLDSYFAMTLVIEPPEGLQDAGKGGSGGRQTVARWVQSTGSILGRAARGATSASVLWLITGFTFEVGAAGAAGDSGGYLIRLHAVRGLSAVVVASFPGSMTGPSTVNAGAKRPQAVLWGQHAWRGSSINQYQAEGLSSHSRFLSSFSAWMSAEDDFPRVTCFDALCCVPDESAQLTRGALHAAAITYATVLAESPTSPTALHQQLEAVQGWSGAAAMMGGTVCAMHCAPSSRMVASMERTGELMLWRLAAYNVEPVGAIGLRNAAPLAARGGGLGSHGATSVHWVVVPGLDSQVQVLAAILDRHLTVLTVVTQSDGNVTICRAADVTLTHDAIALQALTVPGGAVGEAEAGQVCWLVVVGNQDQASCLSILEITSAAVSSSGGGIGGFAGGAPGVSVRNLATAQPFPGHLGPITACSRLHGAPAGLLLGSAEGAVHSVSLQYNASTQKASFTPTFATVEVSGKVVALAMDVESGTVAAVTSGESTTRLSLWQPTSETSSNRRTSMTSTTGTSKVVQQPSTSVRLPEDASSVAWVPGMAMPCVAVGCASDGVALYAPTRGAGSGHEGWQRVAHMPRQPGTAGVPLVAASRSRLVAAAGPCVLSLSDKVVIRDEEMALSR